LPFYIWTTFGPLETQPTLRAANTKCWSPFPMSNELLRRKLDLILRI
jgi:hypothetical protein